MAVTLRLALPIAQTWSMATFSPPMFMSFCIALSIDYVMFLLSACVSVSVSAEAEPLFCVSPAVAPSFAARVPPHSRAGQNRRAGQGAGCCMWLRQLKCESQSSDVITL